MKALAGILFQILDNDSQPLSQKKELAISDHCLEHDDYSVPIYLQAKFLP